MNQKFVIGIEDSALVIPKTIGNIAKWNRTCLDYLNSDKPDHYTKVVAMVLSHMPILDIESVLNSPTNALTRGTFSYAPNQSQFEIALECLKNLCSNDELANIFIYSHCSIEEAIYTSNVARLAAELNWSNIPHFAVSQTGNISFFQSLKILNQTMQGTRENEGFSVFCSAEKWPIPYPRSIAGLDPLSDGACALKINHGSKNVLLELKGLYHESYEPFIFLENGNIEWNQTATRAFFQSAIGNCLTSMNIENLSKTVLFISSPSTVMSHHVAWDLGLEIGAIGPTQLGFFASMDVPVMVHEVLEQLKTNPNRWRGYGLLFCSVSLNGNFAGALFFPKL